MNEKEERQRFEAWAQVFFKPHEMPIDSDGNYEFDEDRVAWATWLAALPSRPFDWWTDHRSDTRQPIHEVMEIVESYGPWGTDINGSLQLQIILADEVKTLRASLADAMQSALPPSTKVEVASAEPQPFAGEIIEAVQATWNCEFDGCVADSESGYTKRAAEWADRFNDYKRRALEAEARLATPPKEEGAPSSDYQAGWNNAMDTMTKAMTRNAIAPEEGAPSKPSADRESGDVAENMQIMALFEKVYGGPNPYYRCKKCGAIEPGVREYLVAHLAAHSEGASK